LVEARHPERFTPAGTARWRGRIYNSLTPSRMPQRIYRGEYGTAAYQSVYHGGGHLLDLVHQIGVPAAVLLLLTAPLALISPWLGLAAALAVAGLAVLAGVDMARADPPRRGRHGLGFRASVAVHHLLQPLVRHWARSRHRQLARRNLDGGQELPEAVRRLRGGIVIVPEDRPRAEFAAALIEVLRRRGIRATQPSGWEDCDARLLLSPFLVGKLQTSSHPEGFVQVRIRGRPRPWPLVVAVATLGAAAVVDPFLAALLALPGAGLAHGALRARRLPAQLLPSARD
jgi:hypothetical protein